jgi:hypothetical protein
MKKLLSFGAGLALLIFSSQLALAKIPTGLDGARTVRAEQANTQELRQANAEQRCQTIQNRFDVQVARYTNNTEKHTARYERMLTRLEALVVRLQTADIDTTGLEASIAVLEGKVDQFVSDANAFIAALGLAQETACDDSETNLLGQVVETRSLLQILREDVLDIRNYWQQTLRPLITSLVEQLDSNEASEESEE